MTQEKEGAASSAEVTTVSPVFFSFCQAVLRYLQHPEASETQHGEELAVVEAEAQKLKGVTGAKGSSGKEIDTVVQLLREYYPTEGDSDDLEAAIETLTNTMRRDFGVC